MKHIKVLGPGCARCKATYANALEAVKTSGVEASVEKIEDFEAMLKYDVLGTPVLVVDEVSKIKGRVATVEEITALLRD
ncbi:MAG: thioredoxin family protein [Spirochaetia bacterium]|nr:thioredoxin family protein [Spirochaetia bacterium]